MIDWNRIVEQEGPAVWRVCWRILGHHADAEEAFQDAFASACELANRQPLGSVRAVLLHLAAARSIDRLRARQRRRKRSISLDEQSLNASLDTGPTPPSLAEAGDLSLALQEALADLPPKQAEAFFLHAIEGWSYQEVATRVSVTVDHVGVLIHRARSKLRQSLARFAPDSEQLYEQPTRP